MNRHSFALGLGLVGPPGRPVALASANQRIRVAGACRRWFALAVALVLPLAPCAWAASGTWISTVSGAWNDSTNWSGGAIANGSGSSANFNTLDIAGDITVTLDGRTLTSLTFGDTDTNSVGGWILTGGALTLAETTPTITVNTLGGTKSVTVQSIVTGVAGLTKSGTGTLVLAAPNTYTNKTFVKAGMLSLGAQPVGASDYEFSGIGQLTLSATNDVTLHNVTFAGGAGSLVAGVKTLTFDGTLTRIAGATAFLPTTGVKFTGAGVASNAILTGMFFSTPLSVNSTFVVIDGTTRIPRSKNYTTDDGGANCLTPNTDFAEIGASNANTHVSLGSGTTAGNLSITSQPSISIKTLYNAYHPTIITLLESNVLTITEGMILNGRDNALTINGGSIFNNDQELIIRSSRTAKDVIINSVITGAGGLTVSVGGQTGTTGVRLDQANTFTGDTRSAYGGVGLFLNHSLALQFSTLDMNSADTGPVTFLKATNTLGGLKGSRNLTLPSTSLSVGNNNQSTSYSGVLSGAGASLVKIGAGALTLSGANSFTNGTIIRNGAIQIGGGNDRLSPAGVVVLGDGAAGSGKLMLSDGTTARKQTVSGLTVSGAGIDNRVVGGAVGVATLTVNIAAGTNTYGGALGGPAAMEDHLALVKTGPGTLALTGASTYAGGTTIDAGVLIAATNGALGMGNVAVGTNGTLRLNDAGTEDDLIADTASVLMSSGSGSNGKLRLQSGVNETVNQLLLDGVAQGSGTYGSSASAAEHKSDVWFDSGAAGVLTVLRGSGNCVLSIR